jgi:hypothetical protein
MATFPSSDESFARLHAAGWSVGEVRLGDGLWLVSGSNGENRIQARGQPQSEAWWKACEQALAAGMLDRSSAPLEGLGRERD